MSIIPGIPENLVEVRKGKALTTSIVVAEVFNRDHKNLLRDIRNLEIPEEWRSANFEPTNYCTIQGQQRPMMLMTRDAFTLLGMGFTGSEAMAWKLKYIEAFNKMEETLSKRDVTRERVIEAFIQELGPYAPMFPRRYYEGLYRLLRWPQNPKGHNYHPGYVGKLTKQLCHSKIAPGVLDELESRNPWDASRGRRPHIHTRLLTDDVGKQALQQQIDFVCRMMDCVDSVQALIDIVERDYANRFGGNKQLSFLKVRYELADRTALLPA